MKNIRFVIAALVLPFLSVAQTAGEEVKLDYQSLVVQGLADESILAPRPYPLQVKTIEIEKGKWLEYAEKGTPYGTPVIFLHGLADSWHSFEKVLPLLPDDYHAFALTQRGHGNADKSFDSFTPKAFAKDVAAFMKKLHIESAVIVGHSMGGMVAQQFAVDYPELITSLVIVGSDASFKNNDGVEDFYKMALGLTDPVDKEFMDAFQKGTMAKPIEPAYYNTLLSEGLKIPARVFQLVIKGMMDTDLLPLLPQITKPVLILWGDKDMVSQLADQQLMRDGMKGAKLVIYPGAGHSLHWEEPQRFARDLLQFFKSIQ